MLNVLTMLYIIWFQKNSSYTADWVFLCILVHVSDSFWVPKCSQVQFWYFWPNFLNNYSLFLNPQVFFHRPPPSPSLFSFGKLFPISMFVLSPPLNWVAHFQLIVYYYYLYVICQWFSEMFEEKFHMLK